MNQTVVDALKAEGGFTKEKQVEVKRECLALIETMLTDAMRLAIETIYGSLELVLDTFIEALSRKQKRHKIVGNYSEMSGSLFFYTRSFNSGVDSKLISLTRCMYPL